MQFPRESPQCQQYTTTRNGVPYLSTQAPSLNDPKFVNARDRIGTGPWRNAKGVVIARNVDELHSPANNVTKETALDEKGRIVNGRTEKPNKHDILTGSACNHDSWFPLSVSCRFSHQLVRRLCSVPHRP